MIDLTGKRILITNIDSALGQGIALCAIETGARVVGAYDIGKVSLNVETIESGKVGLVASIGYDATLAEGAFQLLEDVVSSVGSIHGAVILPQAQQRKPFLEQTDAEWQHSLTVNASDPFFVGQAVAQKMIAQKTPGSIVYISTVASEMPFHEVSLFATSLAALNTTARVSALEMGEHQITVNIVAPGWLQSSDGNTLYFAGTELNKVNGSDVAYIQEGIPLGRIGHMQEVGDLCTFLLSERARYISGAVIPVDGAYAITKTEGNTPFPDGRQWLPFDSGYDPYLSDT